MPTRGARTRHYGRHHIGAVRSGCGKGVPGPRNRLQVMRERNWCALCGPKRPVGLTSSPEDIASSALLPRRRGSIFLFSVVLALALGLAACGGGTSPGVARVGSSSTTTTAEAAGSASTSGLAYAKCMRSHGVPNFPDPNASGGFSFGPAINPLSPAFRSAQAACGKLLSGPPSPGSATHPSAAGLAHILTISRCMRRHGISDFPDPTTSMPSNMTDYEYISNRDGVILAFPRGGDTPINSG
jgi:hypothetical protein